MPEAGTVEMKLEVVTLPVCDIDRARYGMLLGTFPWPLTEPAVPVSSFDLRFLQVRLDDRYHHDPTWLPSRPAFDGTGQIVNFSDSASIDLHRVDAVIAGHKDAEMIGLQGVFGRARSVT